MNLIAFYAMKHLKILRNSVRPLVSINYSLTSYFKRRVLSSHIHSSSVGIHEHSTEFRIHSSDVTANNGKNRQNQLLQRFDEFLSKDTFDQNVWSTLSEELCHQVPTFHDNEIRILAERMNPFWSKFPFQFHHDESLHQLARLIDAEMEKRAPSWNTDEFLIFFQCFSYLPLPSTTSSEFMYTIVKRRLPKIFKEDKKKVVEFLRLMNMCDLWRLYYIPKFRLETFLNNNLSNLSLLELSTVLNSMTRAHVIVNTPNLMDQLGCKLINDVDLTAGDLMPILKFINLQLQYNKFDPIPTVEHLVNKAKEGAFDLKCLIGIAESCRETKYYDVEFFEILSRDFRTNITNVTLDQIKTTLSCLTFFDSTSKFQDFYTALLERLEDSSFLNYLLQHPKGFIHIVYHLCRVGVYTYDLLDIVFSEGFLKAACGKQQKKIFMMKYHVAGRQLLCVDHSLPLECPKYEGNRLKAEVCEHFKEYYCRFLPTLLQVNRNQENLEQIYKRSHVYTRLMYEVRLVLVEVLGGEEFVHTCYVLPHLPRPNLLFAMNEQHVQQRIPQVVTEAKVVDPYSLPKNLYWYTFSIQYRNNATSEPITIMDEIIKVRQLKILNINVLSLVSEVWRELTKNARKDYLKSKVF